MSNIGRRYMSIGNDIRMDLLSSKYQAGDRLPTERDIAEKYGVSRTVVREAIIMLELEGLVEVRKGSGVYLLVKPTSKSIESKKTTNKYASLFDSDMGPFEMLQARQLIESNIAEFAAINITKNEILEIKKVLNEERIKVESGLFGHQEDEAFHILIAEATKNGLLIDISNIIWEKRKNSSMWAQLHKHINTQSYRLQWLEDHNNILMALQRKDPALAKKTMWQHLENVKQALLKHSDIEDEEFDGYLFESYPLL